MKLAEKPPVYDRDESYEVASRLVRWICLALVLMTFPFRSPVGPVIFGVTLAMGAYNALRHSSRLRQNVVLGSRLNNLVIDHVFVLALVLLSGGFSSPYYPFFFLLMIGSIATYGLPGMAMSLAGQVLVLVLLLQAQVAAQPVSPPFQFIAKLIFVVIFGLVAQEAVLSRDEEHTLDSRYGQRIAAERQRLLALINSLQSAVLAVNENGRVYVYNAAALALLNTNRDINGEHIDELLPVKTTKNQSVNLYDLMQGRRGPVNRQDLTLMVNDGSVINLDLTLAPVMTTGPGEDMSAGYIVVARDITKQKSLDEQRDEFISVTSHELRTPLAIAEANLSTALMPGYAKIQTKAAVLLEQAHENIVFMGMLIKDLSVLAKAERGDLKLELQMLNPTHFVQELARDYRGQVEAKGLKFIVQAPDGLRELYTSEHEVREILQNFLTNAIKYTPSGSITLSVTQTPTGTVFAVKDTGIGLSASDKRRVFEKFWRSEDYRTRATGGTGLGLYITHKLAERLGGHIDFNSRLNHGSTFSLTLPAVAHHEHLAK